MSHGDAGEFHRTDPVAARAAVFHQVTRPTLVLGSAQADAAVDHRVAAALGVDVVRRRSGGGAVLLLPGEFVWLDLVLPAGDPLWCADVAQAMVWVGELWRAALADVGVPSRVHAGPLQRSEWSAQVCWAGLGTGEVRAAEGPGKLVGVSQRRTRQWARFQSMAHLRWRPELAAALVAIPRPPAATLAPCAAATPAAASALQQALLAHLPR